jgi:hypothetical protein
MPPEAISLALAASIYPPALAAVIALGRGSEVRLRVVLLVAAAYLTVLVTGALILLLFAEVGATGEQVRTPAAALYIAGGLVLLGLAERLRRPRQDAGGRDRDPPAAGPPGSADGAAQRQARSRTERYLGSRRLVIALGVILYIVPSPIYIGALKQVADTNASASTQIGYLVVMLLVMLWMIELPMLLLIAFPERAVLVLERVNSWFARHGRSLGAAAAGVAGVYLLVVGIVEVAG